MNKTKLSLILNLIIVVFVTIASIMMFANIRISSNQMILESDNIKMFRFFTVDSNLLVGIASLIMIIFEAKLLKNKIKTIPKRVYILKELAVVGVSLTFLVTAIFLGPTIPSGYLSLYTNSNLFFHLLVPIISVISYVLYEKYDNKYIYALYGLIPVFLYSIYYVTMIFTHLNNGAVDPKYDFYNFLNGNVSNAIFTLPIIFISTYLISIILISLNKKLLK